MATNEPMRSDEEAQAFVDWWVDSELRQSLVALRDEIEEICANELKRWGRRSGGR